METRLELVNFMSRILMMMTMRSLKSTSSSSRVSCQLHAVRSSNSKTKKTLTHIYLQETTSPDDMGSSPWSLQAPLSVTSTPTTWTKRRSSSYPKVAPFSASQPKKQCFCCRRSILSGGLPSTFLPIHFSPLPSFVPFLSTVMS